VLETVITGTHQINSNVQGVLWDQLRPVAGEAREMIEILLTRDGAKKKKQSSGPKGFTCSTPEEHTLNHISKPPGHLSTRKPVYG